MFKKLIVLPMLLLLPDCVPSQQTGPMVLAASSMTEALTEAGAAWAGKGHAPPVLSFSASSALARQVSEGAPADLAITADAEWMDWLDEREEIDPASRRDIAGNSLVLIAPVLPNVRMRRFDDPAEPLRGLDGRLALADPDSIPAGRYARAALSSMDLWQSLEPHVVSAENVRAALALVERGEAQMGIVYFSDAAASAQVFALAAFDERLHPPIRYLAARTTRSDHPDAAAFLDFLTQPEAQAILARHGFRRVDCNTAC